MQSKHLFPLYVAGLLSVLLTACASESPVLDAHWGHSLSQAQARQSAYPGPRQATAKQIETDAVTSSLGIVRYQKSFETPPPPVNVLNLGVGTPGGAPR